MQPMQSMQSMQREVKVRVKASVSVSVSVIAKAKVTEEKWGARRDYTEMRWAYSKGRTSGPVCTVTYLDQSDTHHPPTLSLSTQPRSDLRESERARERESERARE